MMISARGWPFSTSKGCAAAGMASHAIEVATKRRMGVFMVEFFGAVE
jgi:hypothetical protein